MKKAQRSDRDMILSYLEKDIENCLYMYSDIWKYGPDAEQVSVWYDTDELGPRMVVMKYHRNFQLYANRGYENVEGILKLIEQEKPLGISGRKEIITQLEVHLSNLYRVEYGVIFKGYVFDLKTLERRLEGCSVQIERASENDVPAIAHLLYMDDELKRGYTEKSLAQELADRIRTGMGRSYMIRDGSEIVAHNATYAESDKFVIMSGLMVHPDYRETEYADWITLRSTIEIEKEGKDRYFFVIKKRIIRWHKRMWGLVVAEYGKLTCNRETK